jgi:hypothetical protein
MAEPFCNFVQILLYNYDTAQLSAKQKSTGFQKPVNSEGYK